MCSFIARRAMIKRESLNDSDVVNNLQVHFDGVKKIVCVWVKKSVPANKLFDVWPIRGVNNNI